MALNVVASTQSRAVLVYVSLDDGSVTVSLTPDEARRVARMLNDAADAAEPGVMPRGLGIVTARTRVRSLGNGG